MNINDGDQRISFGEGEGEDNVRPGNGDYGCLARLHADIPQIPLYSRGSLTTKVTAPNLYPNGIGDPQSVATFSTLNEPLHAVNRLLKATGKALAVVSGFLSPANQLARFQVLYTQKNPEDPRQEILAGRYADSAGSVAEVIKDQKFYDALNTLVSDSHTMNNLKSVSDNKEPEMDELVALAQELITYRANMGKINLQILPHTATSVHNLGHSVNVVLTDGDGTPLNMGVGVDIVSPVQRVDYFEQNGPNRYEAKVESDPLLQAYLRSLGITKIDERVVADIQQNRRSLFFAMQRGFKAYKGEQGHFTRSRPDGNYPSREYVYRQAEKLGYNIAA